MRRLLLEALKDYEQAIVFHAQTGPGDRQRLETSSRRLDDARMRFVKTLEELIR